jgi:CheY-like chemotaxis protein
MMERLFTPFDRLGADASGIEGTGIGLALSKRLTELMGGTLWAQSTLGQGTTFIVDLAIGRDPAAGYDETDLGQTASALEPGDGYVGTVVYVEDNPSNLHLVERILARRPGLRLLTTNNGEDALALIRGSDPTLVLLDVHLPGLDGSKVLRRLRVDPATASIPVVMISADATPGRVKSLLAAGARDYLTKPLDVTRFLEVLDAQLDAATTAR